MLELLAGVDSGAGCVPAQRRGVERVSNPQTRFTVHILVANIHITQDQVPSISDCIVCVCVCRGRRTLKKTLLEEVQELEARAVDPGAAVLRDASGRRCVSRPKRQTFRFTTSIHYRFHFHC